MTDTSPSDSDFDYPSSAPPSGSAGEDGVTSSLAELESKLHELESKLNAMGAEPEQPSPPPTTQPPAPESTGFEPPAAEDSPARLIDEASADAPVVDPSTAYASRLVDEAIQTDTQSSAERLAPATLAELLSFRERLERLTQDLLEDYNQLLVRLTDQPSEEPEPTDESFQTFAPIETAPAPEAHTHQPTRETPAPEPASESFQTFAPIETAPAPEAHTHQQPQPTREIPEPALPPLSEFAQMGPVASGAAGAVSEQELTQFEGHVELGVGPFYNDMRWLSEFEIRLGRLPNVTKASVRRVEAGHAVLDLELSAPVALLAQLRTAVDGDFSVREISESRLAITLEDS